MFEPPDHYHNLSLGLSEVLDDIGVNERIVMMRRRCWLLTETMLKIKFQTNDIDSPMFIFGSQSEGSTTLQLSSDIDSLVCNRRFQIIQDFSDWQPDKLQLLLVQDETTSPGYCLLQILRPDVPLPVEDFQQKDFTRDRKGRILLNHSAVLINTEGRIRHGPAQVEQGVLGKIDNDWVPALICSSWPKEAEPWLQQQNMSGWPTEDMKRYAAEHGCFVVAVASRESPNQDIEWRISTSHAERCLMFNINMTQLRCYILMKMILKTFFKPRCEDAISSFMCKNVLFHCILNSSASEWCDNKLITRLNQCLHFLCNCILTQNCPHFIIPRNNLLAGKLTIHVKEQLIEVLCNMTGNIEQSLLGISIDQIGERLYEKSGGRILTGHLISPEINAGRVIAALNYNTALKLKMLQNITRAMIYHKHDLSVYNGLIQDISTLCQIYSAGSKMEQVACRYFTPLVCANLGSIAASKDLYHSQAISPVSLMWFSAGSNTDFSSSRLELASSLYCAGQNRKCETILAELCSRLDQTTVVCVCSCFVKELKHTDEFFQNMQRETRRRCDYKRSTEEDRAYRGIGNFWMDWAAVDSLTFLHYMEYKVYTQFHRPVEQHRALYNLIMTINPEPNLGHKETALNLLGQCMEQENRLKAALCCYKMSLNERRRNNVAKWHVCRLIARLFRCRHRDEH